MPCIYCLYKACPETLAKSTFFLFLEKTKKEKFCLNFEVGVLLWLLSVNRNRPLVHEFIYKNKYFSWMMEHSSVQKKKPLDFIEQLLLNMPDRTPSMPPRFSLTLFLCPLLLFYQINCPNSRLYNYIFLKDYIRTIIG